MPPLVIPDTIQVTLNWSFSGVPWANNVLHYKADIPPPSVTQDLADDLAAEIGAAYTASGLRTQIGTTWVLTSIGVRDIRTANKPLFTSVAINLAGTATSAPLPPQNACVVTLRTNQAGRSFRGRVYISGLSEDTNTSTGQILTAARTDCVDFINNLQVLEDLGHPYRLQLAVASRTLEESNLVTSITTRDAVWDAQRRRRDGIASQ